MSRTSLIDGLWCRRYRPADDASARLVCLPHAGGSASYFLPVAVALSPAVDVLAMQYPGRQDRRSEPPVTDLMTLADQVAGVLLRDPDPRPLTLFGHSLGAVLGFEVARRLDGEGRCPVGLFVSGRRAPSTYREENTHRLGDQAIMAEVRRLDGTSAALLSDDDVIRAALPALRADYQAAETYRCPPGSVVSCSITALTGADDPKTTVDEARQWDQHTSAAFDLHVFPGGHFFLTEQAGRIIDLLQTHFRTGPAAVS